MSEDSARANSERPHAPDLAAGQARWEREALVGMMAHVQGVVRELRIDFDRLSANLDHMHADTVAIREVLRIPRPECYPSGPRRAAARRARRTPPADTASDAPPATSS